MVNFTQEGLRALSGFILLIMSLASLWRSDVPDFYSYVILTLVAFLAGGSLLQRNKE